MDDVEEYADPDDARAPDEAEPDEYWLVFEADRYATDRGEEARCRALGRLRDLGLVERPPHRTPEGIWVAGPRPPAGTVRAFDGYLHPPMHDHPVGWLEDVVEDRGQQGSSTEFPMTVLDVLA